jgi:hypothetical protein
MEALDDYVIYHIPEIPKVGCMLTRNFWWRRRYQNRAKDYYFTPHRLTREGELVPRDERAEVLVALHAVTKERARTVENFFQRAYGCLTEREEATIGARAANEKMTREQRQEAGRIGGRNQPREVKARNCRIATLKQPREVKVRNGHRVGLISADMVFTCADCGRVIRGPGAMELHRRWHERRRQERQQD